MLHNGVTFTVTSGIIGDTSALADRLLNRRRTTYGLFTSMPRLFDQLLNDLLPNVAGPRKKSMLEFVLAKIPTPPTMRKTKCQTSGAGVPPRQKKSCWMAVANRLWQTLTVADRDAIAHDPCLSTLLELESYRAFVAKFGDTATALPTALTHDCVESEAGDEDEAEGEESS